jgi:hypothetical protein
MDGRLEMFGPAIHTYSRAQAIADGNLIDCTEVARAVGFRVSVALTCAVWADCVEWTEEDSARQTHQDQAGRLWDVIWMAHLAARRGGAQASFDVWRIPRGGREHRPGLASLSLVCGPGDAGEPVITILQLGED